MTRCVHNDCGCNNEGYSGLGEWGIDVPAPSTSERYKVKYPQDNHKVPPELDPEWQLRAVVECLAGPLDDDWMSTHSALIARLTASDPQFQYNPRTKAGKALLSDLVDGEECPNG